MSSVECGFGFVLVNYDKYQEIEYHVMKKFESEYVGEVKEYILLEHAMFNTKEVHGFSFDV